MIGGHDPGETKRQATVTPPSGIAEFLGHRNYLGASHGEKGTILGEAIKRFKVSESKVRRAVKLLKASTTCARLVPN
jgi:hypothetical protein